MEKPRSGTSRNRKKLSLAESVRSSHEWPSERIAAVLTPKDVVEYLYNWMLWARPAQEWPEGAWRTWLILAGRGFGKTRTGAETVRIVARTGAGRRIALVGETAADVRDVMVEGPDGILRRSHPLERPAYEPSKRRLTWPNGVVARTYSGTDPDQLRGPQHGFAWVDELAKYLYANDTWDNLMLGLRMGDPRCLVTTTPRPISLLREMIRREGEDVLLTRGSTYDNAENLPRAFLHEIVTRYEGTALGRQELHADLLDETPGALWTRAAIERLRRTDVPDLLRIGIGVDPSVSESGGGASCGIVVAGIDGGAPPRAYVLEDCTIRGAPSAWAGAVADAFRKHRANIVFAEGNQGGGLVRSVLEAAEEHMPVRMVHASHGKAARAEPVSLLYEKGRVFHAGAFPLLEDEMVTWVPGLLSPNRLDALVWVLTELLLKAGSEATAEILG